MLWQFTEYDKNDPAFKYTTKVDIWAAGVILCKLVTGRHPYQYSDHWSLQD
jgi:serine/threonine protein kinase